MKIGTSHRVIWNNNIKDSFDLLKQLGYEAIELWLEYPHLATDLIDSKTIEEIKQKMKETSLVVTIHAPIRDLNLSSHNYGARNEAKRQIKQSIDFANEINANILVIHAGNHTSKKDSLEDSKRFFFEGLKELVQYAEEKQVYLALENMEKRKGEYFLEAEDVLDIMRAIDSDYLKVTFDIAHCYTVTDDIIAYYQKIKQYVVHIHLSDNSGFGSRVHSRMGEGIIDFSTFFKELLEDQFDGSLIIEGYYVNDELETAIKNLDYVHHILEKLNI